MFIPLPLLLPLLYLAYYIHIFRLNILKARSTRLPYLLTPFYEYGPFWRILGPFIHPLLLRLLPSSWSTFLSYTHPGKMFLERHELMRNRGDDILLIVSPWGIIMTVIDASVIESVMSRRVEFPKPTHIYGVLDVYGKNVLTTEGAVWKVHRKVTATQFNERNNLLVWTEAIRKAKLMLNSWTTHTAAAASTTSETASPPPAPTIKTLAEDCMRLTLHIIVYAGFGRALEWPRRTNPEETTSYETNSLTYEEKERGHKQSFQYSLHVLIDHLFVILLSPKWLLRISPDKMHQKALQAQEEWYKYMKEMFQDTKVMLENGEKERGERWVGPGTLMSALVKSCSTGLGPKGKDSEPTLTEEEVIGNTFLTIIAGHETTANTLHYTIMLLAMHPQAQLTLQDELDSLLPKSTPDNPKSHQDWTYETEYPLLAGTASPTNPEDNGQSNNPTTSSIPAHRGAAKPTFTNAIIHETLRLFPPVVAIPKWTAHGSPTITYRGQSHTLTPNIELHLSALGVQRHPRYYASPTSKYPNSPEEDLGAFKPDRWLLDDGSAFQPPRGAYIPFSDGSRACLGKKFGHVELVAVLAVLFKEWNVELVHDGSKEGFERAREKAWEYVMDSNSLLTLKPCRKEVGIRWVRRGGV